jgi:Eco57I restriction-modification methylase/restriction-modification enzyme MmeI-like protein
MATFPSIRIEGGLLGPDLLDQLLSAQPAGQKAQDFGLDGKRNLTDEIASVFADTRALWEIFQHRLARLPDTDPATSVTRHAWMVPFLGLLGYELKDNQRGYEVDGLKFAISHRAGEAEDSPPIHIVGARQELGRVAASGRPRLAPHSLVQEYLNRTESLWGLVTNGSTLRLLRDTTFVRRQAYVEFDLQGMIEEKRFEDFAAFYRLIHRTRLPNGHDDARESLLERYYLASEEQGGRVRDQLRVGVKDCIERLANGFLSHADNDNLRQRVSHGNTEPNKITPEELYRQLLRLVYRFLFLLVSEDRGLVSSEELYREHYSVGRLRKLIDQRAAYTSYDDIWRSLRVLWLVLSDDRPQASLGHQPMATALGLPLLNGELFAPLSLDSCLISNSDLLQAFWALAYYEDRETRVRRRVNYAALGVEELGSVYESLLDYDPTVSQTAGLPIFQLIDESSERRSTGSHYTPPELVAPLIQHALEPVLTERLKEAKTKEAKELAILSIKVCDLACGSGHFLLAAARRLGKELAAARTEADEPAPEAVREAIRDVMTHCIYGVDKNPLAVELCRVALWLESHAVGKPLTFLDHRIRCGDSLVGVLNLEILEHGIPDEAFRPVESDDRTVARELRRLNAREREGPLFQAPYAEEFRQLSEAMRGLDALPEDTVEQVKAKAESYSRLEHRREFERFRLACDVWTSAFFQDFQPNRSHVTTEVLRSALSRAFISDVRLARFVSDTADANSFIHMPLAFPDVLGQGGFDVITGNPPFMGGKKLSTSFGLRYRNWLNVMCKPFPNTADLCAAFFRRAGGLIRASGRIGLIATNTISQGDTREAGLTTLLQRGLAIRFAQRFVKWLGRANVEVNLLVLGFAPSSCEAPCLLDSRAVTFISSRLDDQPEAEPVGLCQNANKAFIGDFVRGLGFILEPQTAAHYVNERAKNADCLAPYLNGDDLNSDPAQKPSRWIICFHDWSLDTASLYPELIQVVIDKVKPEREQLNGPGDRAHRQRWWQFANYREGLRKATASFSKVLVRARVSEMHMMAFVDPDWICSEQVVVFAFDDYFHFALLQSNIHEAWVRRNASTMRTDVRYTPTDCFETFAFPQNVSVANQARAERVGEDYYQHRQQMMLSRQLGLTRTYNLFHNRDCRDEDVLKLRELHMHMDNVILDCYGWSDFALGHDFHTNERGQVRFTISASARRELLRRLLELNLTIAIAQS